MTAQDPPGRQSAAVRLRSATRDLRSLGLGAPLRAGYEASKRFGGHSLVFKHLVPTSGDVSAGKDLFEWPAIAHEVRERTLAAADRIVGGTIGVFGRDLDVEDVPDWHGIIEAPGAWPVDDWWRIDIRSDDRPGDIKWAWEVGRHRHLVILARAAHLEPSDHRYRTVLERHLESWIETNPPEIGVHWYSNLEIALRSIAWLQILSLAGEQLPASLRRAMWHHLHHAGRHLLADLPYTLSTMPNNHLLGDALGLIALGKAFGGKTGQRWLAIGDRIFNRQVARQVQADGSMIEDSVSYHRFVLELLSMRVVLGDAPPTVYDAMGRCAQFLARLGVLDGPVPQYGDWDEGRVFAVADDPIRMEGSVLAALALVGSGALDDWRRMHDEVAWFTSSGEPQLPEAAETRGGDIGAGIGRAQVGRWTVWLKAGSGPSHGHADLSSVAIAVDGRWLVGDPGTATYNGPIETRNRFRSSAAHSVVRVDATDQLEPHRVFRWKHTARGVLGEPIETDESVTMWCAHDAYERLDPPRTVVRIVSVSTEGVLIRDVVSGPAAFLDLAVPLGPECYWDPDQSLVALGGRSFVVGAACLGEIVSSDGFTLEPGEWSRTYGTIQPSTSLVAECIGTTGIQWSVVAESSLPSTPVSGQTEELQPSVVFGPGEVRLVAGSDHATEVGTISL